MVRHIKKHRQCACKDLCRPVCLSHFSSGGDGVSEDSAVIWNPRATDSLLRLFLHNNTHTITTVKWVTMETTVMVTYSVDDNRSLIWWERFWTGKNSPKVKCQNVMKQMRRIRNQINSFVFFQTVTSQSTWMNHWVQCVRNVCIDQAKNKCFSGSGL